MLIVWICSLLALGEMRIALKLFRSKLCIVGFDWIAAAAVDTTRATSSPSIFQEISLISTHDLSRIFFDVISKTFLLFP